MSRIVKAIDVIFDIIEDVGPSYLLGLLFMPLSPFIAIAGARTLFYERPQNPVTFAKIVLILFMPLIYFSLLYCIYDLPRLQHYLAD